MAAEVVETLCDVKNINLLFKKSKNDKFRI